MPRPLPHGMSGVCISVGLGAVLVGDVFLQPVLVRQSSRRIPTHSLSELVLTTVNTIPLLVSTRQS